jgi:hypothetical protein
MTKNLPTESTLAQGINISPEGLLVANTYLELGGVAETATALNLPRQEIVQYLNRSEVKNYVDTIFLNTGYANRDKIFSLMDKIIEKKLLELEEAEIGSSKDILELITAAHKMRMEEIKAMNAVSSGPTIKKQTNIQVNNDSNYNALLERLAR